MRDRGSFIWKRGEFIRRRGQMKETVLRSRTGALSKADARGSAKLILIRQLHLEARRIYSLARTNERDRSAQQNRGFE